jgi:tRNA threonylcarbamoyladenosine modification (KEOPS) complex  Pcc1 subunit
MSDGNISVKRGSVWLDASETLLDDSIVNMATMGNSAEADVVALRATVNSYIHASWIG